MKELIRIFSYLPHLLSIWGHFCAALPDRSQQTDNQDQPTFKWMPHHVEVAGMGIHQLTENGEPLCNSLKRPYRPVLISFPTQSWWSWSSSWPKGPMCPQHFVGTVHNASVTDCTHKLFNVADDLFKQTCITYKLLVANMKQMSRNYKGLASCRPDLKCRRMNKYILKSVKFIKYSTAI